MRPIKILYVFHTMTFDWYMEINKFTIVSRGTFFLFTTVVTCCGTQQFWRWDGADRDNWRHTTRNYRKFVFYHTKTWANLRSWYVLLYTTALNQSESDKIYNCGKNKNELRSMPLPWTKRIFFSRQDNNNMPVASTIFIVLCKVLYIVLYRVRAM